jgi:hypothetical protein
MKKGRKPSKASLDRRTRQVRTCANSATALSTESDLARVAREVGMPPGVVAAVERDIEEQIKEFTAAVHDFYLNPRRKPGKRRPKRIRK